MIEIGSGNDDPDNHKRAVVKFEDQNDALSFVDSISTFLIEISEITQSNSSPFYKVPPTTHSFFKN